MQQHPQQIFRTAGPSPLHSIEVPGGKDITLLLKREDLLYHPSAPEFCGNKWRKLKYNLYEAADLGHETLLTFGGAFSNHIAAVAAAGRLLGFRTIGLIRGEADAANNPTLAKAQDYGMELHFLTRTMYREKNDPAFRQKLTHQFGEVFILPEGGSNELALKGCEELADEIVLQSGTKLPDVVCCAAGTGGTMAGLIRGFGGKTHLMGFPALKGSFMTAAVQDFLPQADPGNWSINSDYHFGGYAKHSPQLIEFIRKFHQQHQILLDPVYTGKMLFGVFDLIEKGHFAAGSTVLAIHSGGIQGNSGMNLRMGEKLLPE